MPRVPAHPIEPLFLHRWSPRAMSGEAIAEADLLRLFEAARWAPSCNNSQPWRFLYARAGTPSFATFLDLLVPGNQAWCQRAGALLCVVSKNTFDNGTASPTPVLDTGAAWVSLALQGSTQGLVVHGMAGFDYDRAKTALRVPEDHSVHAMVAVGHPGRREDLPPHLQGREEPSDRKPVSSLIFEGGFPE